MDKKLFNYFEKLYSNDKIGHAFLICNCSFEYIKDELTDIISKLLFLEETDIENSEDIIVINPENGVIKKESIQNLHEKVMVTSQVHNKKIYIINECEKMNDSASNSLLKLLEEPEENIYAFLISKNSDNVLKTIYSRCQILKFYNEDISESLIDSISEEEKEMYFNFLITIENEKMHSIAYSTELLKNIKDRENLKKMLNFYLLIYRDVLNIKLYNLTKKFKNKIEELNLIASKLSEKEIVKRLDITSKFIGYIDYNLNTSLLFDRYIIEVVGDDNE